MEGLRRLDRAKEAVRVINKGEGIKEVERVYSVHYRAEDLSAYRPILCQLLPIGTSSACLARLLRRATAQSL